jgi:hypothetical protein
MAGTNVPGGWKPRLPILIACVAFLAGRLAVISLPLPESDVGIYARYAREQAIAAGAGESFPAFHGREVEREADEARAAGNLTAPIDEYKDVEYPPLALALMRLPSLVVGEPRGQVRADRAFEASYYRTFRFGMAVVDVALFGLLVALVKQYFPNEAPDDQGQRLLVYVACTLVLWHVLYDRLDLLLSTLVVVALALLTSRFRYIWSYGVLAAAILFKLVPAVLVPVWVIGAMSASKTRGLTRRDLVPVATRVVLLLALVVAESLPFYVRDGGASFNFLAYHRARPLEIGSVCASLPLALHLFGQPITASYSYGSINLRSPLADRLASLCPWLTAVALLAATGLLFFHANRLRGPSACEAPGRSLAADRPRFVVSYALLFLMLFVATGKVFSTQYLLWLAPLVALLPMAGGRRTLFAWAFVGVCLLSTILVPFLFLSDLVDPSPPVTVPPAIRVPTPRLAALLILRNAFFVGLVGGLVIQLAADALRGYRDSDESARRAAPT